MSQKQIKWILFSCILIAIISVILVCIKKKPVQEKVYVDNKKPERTIPEEKYGEGGFIDMEHPVKVGPMNVGPRIVNDPYPLPTYDRVKVVLGLLEKGLPVVPNMRKTNHDRIADKTVEQMVAEIGDPWSASANMHSVVFDLSNPAFLYASFEQNLRVKKLIHEGRKNPEHVGSLVSNDLLRRMNEWLATAQARIDNPNAGILVANDGTTLGCRNALKYEEDTYALAANIFVLMNIEYSKGLDVLAQYSSWHGKDRGTIAKVRTPDGRLEDAIFYNLPGAPNKSKLDDNVLFSAVSHLLAKSNDPKYAKAKEYLSPL